MSIVYLIIAIVFETAGTTALKLSDGFSKPWFGVAVLVCYACTFSFLSLTLKELDVSIAYAIWAGVGTALIATIGILWFNEPLNALKIISLILIIGGVVGLNLSGEAH